MKNIELKTQVENLDIFRTALAKVEATLVGKMRQLDTYYNQKNGRLKMREINEESCELILYNRPDSTEQKISDYTVEAISKEECSQRKLNLKESLGEKIIVEKERELWLIGNTRIHLDNVKNLGTFLELETVVKGEMSQAQKEFDKVVKILDLSNRPKIAGSYYDLLLAKI